jgi:hypothetical protein
LLGALHGVIHIGQKYIFECQSPTGFLKVLFCRFHDGSDPDLVIDRHQSIAERIVGGVEADRQVVRSIGFRQPFDRRWQANGADGDASR